LLKSEHAHHAESRKAERRDIEPRGLIEAWQHDDRESRLRDAAFGEAIAGHHLEMVTAGREVVIVGDAPAGGGHPALVDAIQLVPEGHALGRAQSARGEFDLDVLPAGLDNDLGCWRNPLVVDYDGLDPHRRVMF